MGFLALFGAGDGAPGTSRMFVLAARRPTTSPPVSTSSSTPVATPRTPPSTPPWNWRRSERRWRTAAADLAGVDVVVPPGGLAPLIHHRPTGGLQAKFSLEYAVAAALLDGDVSLASFEDDRARRADVQDVPPACHGRRGRDAARGAPAWTKTFAAVVTISLAEGRRFSARVDQPAGHATRPVSEDQLRAKFADCLASTGIGSVDERYAVLRTLRRQPSARLVLDVLTDSSSGPG